MFAVGHNSVGSRKGITATLVLLMLVLPFVGLAKKKKDADANPKQIKAPDYSMFVWPSPPAITRVKFTTYYSGDKLHFDTAEEAKQKNKAGWMDRLAGSQTTEEKKLPPHFQLVNPHGIAVDSKGRLYVADTKVGAIFVFDTETRETQLIKNGVHAHFSRILGIAIDDTDDRLFIADADLRHVLVMDADQKVTNVITEGLVNPSGVAIDTQNRLLYVSDVETDLVTVFDADSFKVIRKIGTPKKNHTLTTPGDFAKPTGLAVDKDGNLYVADTMNNRIEIFDADGGFISQVGKHGDAPGYLARPKGVAVDSDGNIWVADGMQDRVHVMNRDGQLLTWIGGHHVPIPGDFVGLANIFIDKKDRVFTSEVYPGRVQQFLYITDAQAAAEKKRREDEAEQKAASKRGVKTAAAPAVAPVQSDNAPAKP